LSDNKNTAARSLVRADDKRRKMKSAGEDTTKQEKKVKTAEQLFNNTKKKGK
jgi:hypothetical protein